MRLGFGLGFSVGLVFLGFVFGFVFFLLWNKEKENKKKELENNQQLCETLADKRLSWAIQ